MAIVTVIPPNVGDVSTFTFKDPFHDYVSTILNRNDTKYRLEVISVMSMGDMIRMSHRDPYTDVYNKVGISVTDYQQDLNDDVLIVSFSYRDDGGGDRLFRVPVNYIQDIVTPSNVEYQNRSLVFNLGLLPKDLDLSGYFNDFKDYILYRTGVNPELRDVTIGETYLVGVDESEQREAIRKNNTSVNKTITRRLEETELILASVLDQLDTQGISLEK